MKKFGLLISALTVFCLVAKAQNVTIPDANFKSYLVGSFAINTNSDNEIQVAEAAAYTGQIYCPSLSISDLTGIEAFTALTGLIVRHNSISSLDVSNNTALTNLDCGDNNLSSLDVTNNTALTDLLCYENNLSSLDVTNNTALTQLGCAENNLSSLDVTNNTALTALSCWDNNISNLDVTNDTSLTLLNCDGNNLSSLDVSNNTALYQLLCHDNNLSSLDVTNNTLLTTFYCNENNLTSLDVTSNTLLTTFQCSRNNLSNLDMRNLSTITLTSFSAVINPNLSCITVDNVALATAAWANIDATTSYSTNCVTGTTDLTKADFTIYPNPAASYLQIETTQRITSMSIRDISGKVIKTLDRGSNRIDVTRLSGGVYILTISTSNGTAYSRFVKE